MSKQALNVIEFRRPHGERIPREIEAIRPEALAYLKEHNVKVSIEAIGMGTAVYFDAGFVCDDNETPNELVYIWHPPQSIEDLFDMAVKEIKEHKEMPGNRNSMNGDENG